jgi:hypothetical protein
MDKGKIEINHLVGKVMNYCIENTIKWNMDIGDENVKFTFRSDPIAHKVQASINSPYIIRDGSSLIVPYGTYDDSPKVDMTPRAQKIRHIMIAVLLMISLWILFFIWLWD